MFKTPETQRPTPPKSMLLAALYLFREQGYEATKISEIAKSCGLSQDAILAHFKSKDEIFVALFTDDFEQAFETLEPFIKGPHSSALKAVNEFCDILAKQHVSFITPALWRVAISKEMANPHSNIGWHFGMCLTKVRATLKSLLDRLVELELLGKNTDTSVLADCLHNQFSMCFLALIRSDDTPFENFEMRIKRLNALVLQAD